MIPYILFSIFVLTNIITECWNIPAMNPLTQPMSAYLASMPSAPVKLAWSQVLGFASMAVGLLFLGHLWGGGYLMLLGVLGALGLIVVVATKLMISGHPTDPANSTLESIHVKAAGVAFLSVAAMILAHTWGHFVFASWLTVAAAAFDLLYLKFGSPKFMTAVQEKVTTACYLIAIFNLL